MATIQKPLSAIGTTEERWGWPTIIEFEFDCSKLRQSMFKTNDTI